MRIFMLLSGTLMIFGLVCVLMGCSSSNKSLPNQVDDITVSISPETATVPKLGAFTFTATVAGASNAAVLWSVTESTGGHMTTGGVYHASNVPGTYHVVASSVENPGKFATATVTVTNYPVPNIGVCIYPKEASIQTSGQLLFTAVVTGSTNTDVNWSVDEGNGGVISEDGLYTAPETPGIFHIRTTSDADPTKSDTATVTVTE